MVGREDDFGAGEPEFGRAAYLLELHWALGEKLKNRLWSH